ncbi:MAG: hypothetical protein AABX37_03210, partial [Nanoarchaeota archaeon]
MHSTSMYTPETLTERTSGLTSIHRDLYETVMALQELAARIGDSPLNQTAAYNIQTKFTEFADTLSGIDLLVEAQQNKLGSFLEWAELLDGVNQPLAKRVYSIIGKRLDILYKQREGLSIRIAQLTTLGEDTIALAAPSEGQTSTPYAELLEDMTAEEQALSTVREWFKEGTDYLNTVFNHVTAVREPPEERSDRDYGLLMTEAHDALSDLLHRREEAKTSQAAAEAAVREAERRAGEADARAAEANLLYETANDERTTAVARAGTLEADLHAAEGRVEEATRLYSERGQQYKEIEEQQSAVLARAETAERFDRDFAIEVERLRSESGLNTGTITALQEERDELRGRVDAVERELTDYKASEQGMTAAEEENARLHQEAETREAELRQAYRTVEAEQERYRLLQSSVAVTEARAAELAT